MIEIMRLISFIIYQLQQHKAYYRCQDQSELAPFSAYSLRYKFRD
jgi:hypothetical protein